MNSNDNILRRVWCGSVFVPLAFPLLAFAVLAFAAGCAKEEAPADEATIVPVQVAAAERDSIQRIIRVEGVLSPFNQAAIVPKIGAPIRSLPVNRGDRVREGQVLAVLENRDLAAAVAENKSLVAQMESAYRSTTAGSGPEELRKAQLDVETQKQSLDAAQKVYESRQELFRQGAIARKLVDEANVAYVQAKNESEIAQRHLDALQKVGNPEQTASAQTQIDAAKARLENAEVQLSYSQIVSPIDGVVTDRPLFVGETASPEKPILTVMDVSRVIAKASVPNAQLDLIKVGDAATIALQDGSLKVGGRVTVISSALDPNSTTAEVWVQADNPREVLHPGETVNVSIVTETVKDAIVVPTEALLPAEDGSIGVVVVGKDLMAHQRKVEIGIREPEKIQISKGLDAGEQVIVAGGLGLEDGAKVKIGAAEKEKPEKTDDEKPDAKDPKKDDKK